MPYLVKAVTTSGCVTWMLPPDRKGNRSLSNMAEPQTFENEADARAAIADMPEVFSEAGITFTVEAADQS